MDIRQELKRYLQNIGENLRLDPPSEEEILREIEAHVEDCYAAARKNGLSEREAMNNCLVKLGPARTIAKQVYVIHSQSTWRQALLAGLPHLFFAALLMLDWLAGLAWIPAVLFITLGTVGYALGHGRPAWLFPWLGYSLLPVVAAGLSLLYLPAGLSWISLVIYAPLVVWLSCFVTIKFIRHDWLFSALMLLPVPTFIGWYFAMKTDAGLPFKTEMLHNFSPWTGISFLLLGLCATLFMRLTNRLFRILSLGISGLVSAAIITLASNSLGLPAFVGLVILLVCFLVVPAIVERRMKHTHDLISA